MAELDIPVTSQHLAKSMQTNPVVVRRILGELRNRGYVRSEKGHGGGWALDCDLSQVTLRDIYSALGNPSLLAIGHRTESPDCLVEKAVNATLGQAFQDAEEILLTRLEEVTLEMLRKHVHSGLTDRRQELGANAGECQDTASE